MKMTATALQWLVRLAGLLQIILGVLFWTGNALTLIPLHMLVGLLLVLALWALAGIAAFAHVSRGRVALAFVWGRVATRPDVAPAPAPPPSLAMEPQP